MSMRFSFLCSGAALGLISLSCHHQTTDTAKVQPWKPGVTYPTPSAPVYRGFLDKRGLIHSHNVHSHDACDNQPDNQKDANGNDIPPGTPVQINRDCYNQFRDDLCVAQIDYAFLTEHGSRFDTTEFDPHVPNANHPEILEGDNTMLWSQSKGDQLLVRNNNPVANIAACASGQKVLLMPGLEGNNLMPVGLEKHFTANPDDRGSVYGVDTDPMQYPGNTDAVVNAINSNRENGAVVLVAHPENLSEEELATFPIDGFEMYNVHANVAKTAYGVQQAGNLIANLLPGGDITQIPNNADTVFLGFFQEDPRYLSRWAYALSQGQKRVTTMGSDCHQNAIPQVLSKKLNPNWDDMRGDKYQRVMRWFSNHLLVTPNADGSWDDVNLKAALKAGRLYGAFEVLGIPVGFDYHATAGSTVSEMGDEVQLSTSPTLSVKLPAIENFDTTKKAPQFTVRILLADGENWDEVAKGSGDLTFTPTKPGAYRAEIREIPYHLEQDLGPVAEQYLSHDYVWIYSNPIYVK